MTRLINLKRESKLTLEQKGNQGRVKTLLWLRERKKRFKKRQNPFASGLRLLQCPPHSLLHLGPQGCAHTGLVARLREVLWDVGRRPCPTAPCLVPAEPLCMAAPHPGPCCISRAAAAPWGQGRSFPSKVSSPPSPRPPLTHLLVHFNVQPVGHLIVLGAKSQHSVVRGCPEQTARSQPGARDPPRLCPQPVTNSCPTAETCATSAGQGRSSHSTDRPTPVTATRRTGARGLIVLQPSSGNPGASRMREEIPTGG